MSSKSNKTKEFSAICEVNTRGKSIQLRNGLINRIFSYEEGFRTSVLRFEPDGRNLVDPKHKFGIHGEIEEETAPCREIMIGIDGIDYNIGLGQSCVTLALAGNAKKLEIALEEEEKHEREVDQNYWLPLIAELEKIRHRKSLANRARD